MSQTDEGQTIPSLALNTDAGSAVLPYLLLPIATSFLHLSIGLDFAESGAVRSVPLTFCCFQRETAINV